MNVSPYQIYAPPILMAVIGITVTTLCATIPSNFASLNMMGTFVGGNIIAFSLVLGLYQHLSHDKADDIFDPKEREAIQTRANRIAALAFLIVFSLDSAAGCFYGGEPLSVTLPLLGFSLSQLLFAGMYTLSKKDSAGEHAILGMVLTLFLAELATILIVDLHVDATICSLGSIFIGSAMLGYLIDRYRQKSKALT